jgi:hypothetical protein
MQGLGVTAAGTSTAAWTGMLGRRTSPVGSGALVTAAAMVRQPGPRSGSISEVPLSRVVNWSLLPFALDRASAASKTSPRLAVEPMSTASTWGSKAWPSSALPADVAMRSVVDQQPPAWVVPSFDQANCSPARPHGQRLGDTRCDSNRSPEGTVGNTGRGEEEVVAGRPGRM